jgi:hypothetical protein
MMTELPEITHEAVHHLVNAMFGEEPWTVETEITRRRMLELLQPTPPDTGVYLNPFTGSYTHLLYPR